MNDKKESLDVTITANMMEKEAIQKVREAKVTLDQRERDAICWNGEAILGNSKPLPDIISYRVLPSPVPTASGWKEQLRKETPKKIKEKLEDLKKLQREGENFSRNFDAQALKNIPCNWRERFVTKEEYVTDRRKICCKDFETVEKMIKYVREFIKATEEVLTQREAELNAHEGEIAPLVKECKNLVAKLNRLHPQILKDKRKAEITVLEEKELRKVVQRVREYEELNGFFDVALGRLAQVSVHKPEVFEGIVRPQGLPQLPSRLERLIKRR
jgi:Skp family chaperone for outer membrane proteins